MICKYIESFDFPDHKGWDAYLGKRAEGQIVWISPNHDLVINEGHPGKYCWQGYYDNNEMYGDGFESFADAAIDFEAACFPGAP